MQPLKILVAEDDVQNQSILKLLLTRHGHTMTGAWNGSMAVELALCHEYDLIFMDVQMPEMNGIEAIRQIRQHEAVNQKHTFIVVMTGSVPESILKDIKHAGADTFIYKPFDPDRIIFLVNIVGESKYSSITDIPQHNDDQEEELLDIKGSLPRFNNEPKFYLDNLHEFMHSLPTRLGKIESAINHKNWEEVTAIAHNLRGVAANIGAKQISYLASTLDEQSKNKLEKQASKTYADIKISMIKLDDLLRNNNEISQLLPSELIIGH